MEITSEEEKIQENVKMPNVIGLTYKEAKKILEENGLGIRSEFESEAIITEQLPKEGIQITKGTEIILYTN